MTQSKLLSASEISKHNSNTDCWIVVDGQVWDITSFAPDHPGGPASQSRVSRRVLLLPTPMRVMLTTTCSNV